VAALVGVSGFSDSCSCSSFRGSPAFLRSLPWDRSERHWQARIGCLYHFVFFSHWPDVFLLCRSPPFSYWTWLCALITGEPTSNPNISELAAQLSLPPPYPSAARVSSFEDFLQSWISRVPNDSRFFVSPPVRTKGMCWRTRLAWRVHLHLFFFPLRRRFFLR